MDINVWFADLLASTKGKSGTAAQFVANCIRDGGCPAGPVQFITSVPVIENWVSVLERRFGYAAAEANEQAALLYDYASDGALGIPPSIVVGAGHIPFADDVSERESAIAHKAKTDKRFGEVEDDRHVLLSAVAGEANILATSDVDDFLRGPALQLEGRSDVIIYPTAVSGLVIARPAFVRHWLEQGVVPDFKFIESSSDEFRFSRPARR